MIMLPFLKNHLHKLNNTYHIKSLINLALTSVIEDSLDLYSGNWSRNYDLDIDASHGAPLASSDEQNDV